MNVIDPEDNLVDFPENKAYDKSLREANLLPVSLYLQLVDLLFLSNILEGRHDIDMTRFLQMSVNTRHTHATDSPRFQLDIPEALHINMKPCWRTRKSREGWQFTMG